MYTALKDIGQVFLDTILPERCVVCKREYKLALCKSCQSLLTVSEHNYCIVCDKPSPFGMTHNFCKTSISPDRFISVFDYANPSCAESIITGKYKFIRNVFHILGQIMVEVLKTDLAILDSSTTCITAMPLHKRRQRWRGFNQSEILATILSNHLDIPYLNLLERIINTKTQKDLNRANRQTNIVNSFAIKSEANITHTTILLVDDVATTGSTLKEATKTLKEAGAKQVWCIALAKE